VGQHDHQARGPRSPGRRATRRRHPPERVVGLHIAVPEVVRESERDGSAVPAANRDIDVEYAAGTELESGVGSGAATERDAAEPAAHVDVRITVDSGQPSRCATSPPPQAATAPTPGSPERTGPASAATAAHHQPPRTPAVPLPHRTSPVPLEQ
jgi:hypothetical protein